MNTIFFVLGPESSGNHITSWILTQMGCFGDPQVTTNYHQIMGDSQRLDEFINGPVGDIREIVEPEKPLVYFQSVPHGKRWPDVIGIRSVFLDAGYRMKSILVVRDWYANIQSNYYHRTKTDKIADSEELLMEQWRWIGERLQHLKPFMLFNSSLLFKDPASAVLGLEIFTGLKWPYDHFKMIWDVDRKQHTLLKERGYGDFDKEGKEALQALAKKERANKSSVFPDGIKQ